MVLICQIGEKNFFHFFPASLQGRSCEKSTFYLHVRLKYRLQIRIPRVLITQKSAQTFFRSLGKAPNKVQKGDFLGFLAHIGL